MPSGAVARIWAEALGLDLFESPTVAEFSHVIVAEEAVPGRTEKIARIVNRVETMSAEDVKAALRERKKERGSA